MTGLLAVAAIIAGIVAYLQLPVAAVPRVDFPVISVSASLPGASPETMANSVALPLEREFSTIAGIDQMSSTSGQGTTQITLQFVLGRDIDAAALDVQSALSRAQRRLPAEMTTPPSFRKSNPADAPVVLLNLRGGDVPLYRLNEVAAVLISPPSPASRASRRSSPMASRNTPCGCSSTRTGWRRLASASTRRSAPSRRPTPTPPSAR
ncbi:efflux RND transporter permease subunit [Teichococcus aestuarii]|uniref:efflux RND transporter permease subunit n=1 Tax=Teichococcus aestuarii TaxID=568898 RepID=UPI003614497A